MSLMVKVCGVTRMEDGRAAAGAGADAVGLVFAGSPRQVGVERAREIAAALPDRVLKVGVFVDSPPEEVLEVAERVGLDYVQLHGDEGPEAVGALRSGGLKVMKALRVRGVESLAEIDGYGADLYLLDAWSARARGGTGECFDWSLAEGLRGRDNIVISGGLAPENVREAVEYFRPYGVDASSSLESSPGVKDAEQVRRFISAARG
jgi:phosphoribosylanthranilate isomerase